MADMNFSQIFASVKNNPEFKKYMLIGGILHLLWFSLNFLSLLENMSKIYIFVMNFLFCFLSIFLMGFFIDVIKKNVSTSAEFEFVDFNIWQRFKSGFKFEIANILLQLLLFLILAIIFGSIGLIVAYREPYPNAAFYAGVYVAIAIILALLFSTLLWVLVYPQIIANYVNQNKILAVFDFKSIFKMYKKNFGISCVVSISTFLFAILYCIPIVGFYFDMVWAKVFAKYIQVIKNESEND